jgi:hypothetical protein
MGTVVDLRALFQAQIEYRGRKFDALKDRHIRDTETVLKAATSAQFFMTLTAKQKSQANFQGDKSLVKEANVFLPLQVRAYPRLVNTGAGLVGQSLSIADYVQMFHRGYVELRKLVPDTITVDEDNLANISTGPTWLDLTVANAQAGDQRIEGRRTFIVPENKLFPGGRALELEVSWKEAAALGTATSAELVVEFYGVEFEPSRAA